MATRCGMPRPLRIEYEGALYHVMSRSDRQEAIFLDDPGRNEFVRRRGEACVKMGWQAHAYCLMSNHFHLVVENTGSVSESRQSPKRVTSGRKTGIRSQRFAAANPSFDGSEVPSARNKILPCGGKFFLLRSEG